MTARPERRTFRARQLLLAALLAVTGALAFDLAVERWIIGGDGIYKGRILPPYGPVHGMTEERLDALIAGLAEGPSSHVFRAFDPELGWTNRPGAVEGFVFDSIGARVSRAGDADSGAGADRASGPRRVVCYGDSFTFGSEVAADETWPAALEQLVPGLEVVNLGVPAYGTDQALLRFRRRGLVGADVLVIGLLLENIGRNVNRYRSLYEPMETTPAVKPRFVLGRQGELELVPVPFASELEFLEAVRDGTVLERTAEHEHWSGDRPWIPASATFRVIAARRAIARRQSERLWSDPDSEPYRVTLEILRQFADEAHLAGAQQVVVVVFGTRLDMVWLEEHGEPYWSGLVADLDESGVACVDVASLLASCWREPGVYLEHHLGPEGNRRVAEALATWLGER